MIVAILVSAFLAFFLGFLWYSPLVFGNAWLDSIGKKKSDVEGVASLHSMSIVGWLAAAFVYAFLISHPELGGSIKGYLFLSIALWGAFMLPPKAMAIMHGNFNTKLLWIDGGYHLAGYLIFAFVFKIFVG